MANPNIDQGLFDQIDEDKDGLINVDEFRKYLTAKQIEKDEIDVKTLFDTLDEDKDGKINIDEVKIGEAKCAPVY